MSLLNAMKKDEKRRTRVHYRQIRKNSLNKYPVEDIEELAYLIEQQGQLDDVIVYEQDLNDGAQYTLLGGERRWNAIRYLAEQNRLDGMVNISVLPAPEDVWEEKRLIRTENTYREKDPKVREIEIKQCEEYYDHLCEVGEAPKGLKEDWIGFQLGINGRTVRRYLKGQVKALQPESKETTNVDQEKKEKTLKDAIRNLSVAEKNLEKAVIIFEDLEDHHLSKADQILNELRNLLYPLMEKK